MSRLFQPLRHVDFDPSYSSAFQNGSEQKKQILGSDGHRPTYSTPVLGATMTDLVGGYFNPFERYYSLHNPVEICHV